MDSDTQFDLQELALQSCAQLSSVEPSSLAESIETPGFLALARYTSIPQSECTISPTTTLSSTTPGPSATPGPSYYRIESEADKMHLVHTVYKYPEHYRKIAIGRFQNLVTKDFI